MISSGYVWGQSIIHRLDARLKLLLLLEICVLLFLQAELYRYYAVVCLLAVLIMHASGLRGLLVPLKAIFPLLVLVTVLTPLFYRGGEEVVSFWIIRITADGITEALLLIARFTGIALGFYLFFRTTPLQEFILTLRFFGLPYTAALVITLAFRYIPSIARLLQNVKDAHRLRDPAAGEYQGRGRLKTRIQEIQPVLTSVVIASIKTIPALAMSLEHRGIGSPLKRSSYQVLTPLRKRPLQITAAVAAGFLLSLSLWLF